MFRVAQKQRSSQKLKSKAFYNALSYAIHAVNKLLMDWLYVPQYLFAIYELTWEGCSFDIKASNTKNAYNATNNI